MCGIAGFFSLSAAHPATASAMLAELSRRGPDASGKLLLTKDGTSAHDGNIFNAMLHTRLSILDLSTAANQPMSCDDNQVWICYNGEVYDWERDKAELQAAGAVFHTHSDTEFILQGYLAWGIDELLSRLRGMFAFAILDLRQGKVHLARDRMGEKPLVYSLVDGNLAFGSLVRAVLPFVPVEQRGFSASAIDAYLAHRYIPAPATVFSAIQRLENGYCLEFDLRNRQLKKRRYWQPEVETQDWLPELDRAVAMRTVADRPLGILLSGGIDSTMIACRLAIQGLTQFTSFTAAFPGSGMDESKDAAETAKCIGMDNVAVTMTEDLSADFSRIVADLDQPFADPSCFPTWYLAREVSKSVKVVLVGDGGDELLAGYKRINKHLRTHWRRRIRLSLPVRPSLEGNGVGKLATELSMSWQDAYSLRFSGFTPGQRMYLLGGRSLERVCYWRTPDDIGPVPEDSTGLHQLQAIDFANYLPEYILQKSDLCTMAHGLEGRAPLLDHRLFHALLGVALAERFTQPAKLIFRQAMLPTLPSDFFLRKKRGFNPPLAGWLKTSLTARFQGLGARLSRLSDGKLYAGAVDKFVVAYLNGAEHLAEQVLQLLILDESLEQLARLRATLPDASMAGSGASE